MNRNQKLELLKNLRKDLAELRDENDQRRYNKLANKQKREKLQKLRENDQKKLLLK